MQSAPLILSQLAHDDGATEFVGTLELSAEETTIPFPSSQLGSLDIKQEIKFFLLTYTHLRLRFRADGVNLSSGSPFSRYLAVVLVGRVGSSSLIA